MKHRILALLLALALLFSVLPQSMPSASAAEPLGGQCGENLRWTLDLESGALVITGSGAMYDWTAPENVPWYANRGSVRTVSLPDSLTGIGSYAFAGCTQLSSVTIPDSAGYAVSGGSLPMRAFASEAPASTGPVTLRAGDLIADNYEGLTEAEQALLRSEYLLGQSWSFLVPDADDELVEVDAELRRISAKPFADGDYTWQPISAALLYDGGSESIELTDGKGSFETEANTYHVQVEYALELPLDEALQETLLNGPYRLATGLYNLQDFYFLDSSLVTIAANIMPLKQLAVGIGETRLSDENTIAAILRLCDQYSRNGKFDISLRNAEIDTVLDNDQSLMKYLVTRGESYRQTAVLAYNDLHQVANDEGVNFMVNFLSASDKAKANIALRSMLTVAQELERAATDDWELLFKSPLKEGLSDSDWLALDELVDALDVEQPHENAIVSPLRAGTARIESNVNQHNLTVVVTAGRISPSTVDSAQLTMLESHSRTLHLPDGMPASELLAQIEACGIESAALSAWTIISSENYERSAGQLPAALTEDISYTISYTPRSCALSSDFGLTPASVPYGYNLTLPKHGGTDLVYDYEIDGRSYREGTVYTVRGDVTVRRSENKPWTVVYLNQLTADCYADELTAQEAAILRAEALDGEYLLLRKPDAEDALVSVELGGGAYRVTARSYPSGVEGLTWVPVSGRALSGSGAVLAEFTFTGGSAQFIAEDAVRVEAEYGLTLSSVTEEQLLTLLQLPGVLAEEAKEQKRVIEIPNSVYGSLGELNRTMLNRINYAVKGSDMSDKSKAAVQRILDVCVDEDSAQLYVYRFLTNYRRYGLLYYYQNDNHIMFQAQIRVLNDNLSQIYNDPGFLPLLRDLDYEDKYEKIGNIIEKLGSAYVKSPHPSILLNHSALPELVQRIEAAEDHTAAHSSAERPLRLSETLSAEVPTEAPVTLTVRLCSSAGQTLGAESETVSLPAMKALTAQDVARLEAALDRLIGRLGVDLTHYHTDDVLGFKAGDRLTDAAAQTLTFTPKRYTVRFTEYGEEVGTASFPYDEPVVKLPGCPELLKLYKYSLFGEQIIVGSDPKSYTLTPEQLAGLGEGPLTVTRETLTYALAACVGVGTDAFKGCSSLTSVIVLDPRCEIADSATTLGAAGTTTIYGYPGSTAQSYAQKYGYSFVSMVTTVTAQAYAGVYDGEAHAAQLSVTGPISFSLRYSTTQALNGFNYESAGSPEAPTRTKAGKTTVYYYVKDAVGYYGDSNGSTEIVIRPDVRAESFSGVYDGEPHSATVSAEGGATLYYSTETPLSFANYAASGSTSVPTRSEEGTTTVYYLAVPDQDASEDSCVGGETEIVVLEHTHVYTYKLETAPTEETEGSLSATCSVCGRLLTVTLPALNETDYDYSVRSAPTCIADGAGRYSWKTVSYGVYNFDLTLPALGHNYVLGVCSRCGARQETLLYKGDLESAIAEAEAIDLTPYTEESAAALTAVIAAAKQTLNDAIAQAELDEAEADIYAAIFALTPKDAPPVLDKTGLQAAIAAAEKLTRSDYTDESLAALDTVLNDAKQVLELATVQAELDGAEAALDGAIRALERKPEIPPPVLNRDALRDVISQAEQIQKSDYTLETVVALETALAAAKTAMQDAVVQAELDKAEAALSTALRNLKRKAPAILFDDVQDPGKFYYAAVYWAVGHNPQITNGTSDTTFSPNDGCTRAQVVAFLWRAAGQPAPKQRNNPFTDVPEGKYYTDAVLWAVEQQITSGTSANTFSPSSTCTRGQIVTFLYRFKNKPQAASSSNPFSDVKSGAFYYDAVLWAVGAKVTAGMTETTFVPNGTCTRGQVVTFLYRACS